ELLVQRDVLVDLLCEPGNRGCVRVRASLLLHVCGRTGDQGQRKEDAEHGPRQHISAKCKIVSSHQLGTDEWQPLIPGSFRTAGRSRSPAPAAAAWLPAARPLTRRKRAPDPPGWRPGLS